MRVFVIAFAVVLLVVACTPAREQTTQAVPLPENQNTMPKLTTDDGFSIAYTYYPSAKKAPPPRRNIMTTNAEQALLFGEPGGGDGRKL